MRGRAFLDVARNDAAGSGEAFWRAAVVNAYYSVVLECRDALSRRGFSSPSRQQLHAQVRLRFTFASDATLRRIGDALDRLVRERNDASYDLGSTRFGSPALALSSIQRAEDALALLDAIEADPARLRAAIASLPP
jgi:hypothetical protein